MLIIIIWSAFEVNIGKRVGIELRIIVIQRGTVKGPVVELLWPKSFGNFASSTPIMEPTYTTLTSLISQFMEQICSRVP